VRTEVGWVDLYVYYPAQRTSDVAGFDSLKGEADGFRDEPAAQDVQVD